MMLAYGFLALEWMWGRGNQPGREKGGTERVITVPAIRRALQRLPAPLRRYDCLYCRAACPPEQLME
jgi:hypothetical protein